MNYRLIFTNLVAVLFLAAGPAWAAQPLGLNTFVKDTPAIAASVNENFTTLEEAIPVMWASIDDVPAAVAFTVASGGAVINNLTNINVPDPGGILLINGSVFVNNDEPSEQAFTLNLLIDAVPRENHLFQSYFHAQGENNGPAGEGFTLSYTYATAVAASTYTISQVLEPYATPLGVKYTFNKNNLTVIFFPFLPGTVGEPIDRPGIPAGAHTYTSPPGPFPCEEGDLCPDPGPV